ncbi:unnamed protein product [Ranitomeya imitator]|uniref:PX domain-containing protein n=1 Tax=Ranitomeya imitator TaxID=111125 RepID=A0ABN9LYS0_9NEOB|nr:unnamed protein product [Ranitomeya imitator]
MLQQSGEDFMKFRLHYGCRAASGGPAYPDMPRVFTNRSMSIYLVETLSLYRINNLVCEYDTLYTIYLLHSGQYDPSPAFITCRYSDLERLRKSLRSHYPDEMTSVSFPHKRLHKNFTAETIAKRSRAFEQFLCYLSSVPTLRQSPEFLGFFYLHDMQKAQHLTCTGLYQLALPLWMNCWRLQEKLCPIGPSTHRLLVLAGLVVCHQEMDSLADAQAFSERAVVLFRDAQEQNVPFFISFLQAHIQLSWRVGVDKRSSEAALLRLHEAGHTTHNAPTLKEMLIRETNDITT